MNSSRATSHVRWFSKENADVSRTILSTTRTRTKMILEKLAKFAEDRTYQRFSCDKMSYIMCRRRTDESHQLLLHVLLQFCDS